MCVALTGYQAEDADMVPVNSESVDTVDGEVVLLYPAGIDVDILPLSSSSAAGVAATGCRADDADIADRPRDTVVTMPPDTDLCDDSVSPSLMVQLSQNGE